MTLAANHDGLLLDLDGTVWSGGVAIEHAVEAIRASGLPAMYVTNNASRSATDVAEMLRAIDLDAAEEDVLTSAMAAVTMAERYLEKGDAVYVVGAPSLRQLVQEAGYWVVDSADDAPKVVLHGHNPDTGWHELSEAALSLQRGAKYLATNLDTSLPMERGFMVGNGSMVAAVISATGVVPEAAGKPEPAMFIQAADSRGMHKPLAVGDRLDTDIAGGVAAGMPALHVLTGVSGPRALLQAPPEHRPTYIAADMRGLSERPEALAPGAQEGFAARIDGSAMVLSGGNTGASSLAALRTALDVAWQQPEPPAEVRAESDAAEAALAEWW
ncbi:HAD family hydrolase [Corynebacterium sp. HMSC05H05]|uniref:HAD-IIA family hydrolase n=1 Tax=Corynebacterium sp. HMSC05H05 TaxID=1581119 RepID=UPI0008A198D8|nr:HAD-IIA family hydrolase [Corynebacterium sp. HMSC05H05]OFT58388.1 HAD family hydrolase [Corynebacterium sp. HMSC05H05]